MTIRKHNVIPLKQNKKRTQMSFLRRQESTRNNMYKTIHQYYVYILSNRKNGTLYIGMTNNLERRVFEHKNKLVEGFTKKYDLTKLMYYEIFQHVDEAIKREKRLKKWKRQWKINLIEEKNPNWKDLASDWATNMDSATSAE